jgi:hypothetical protein
MKMPVRVQVDAREFAQIMADLLARRPGYLGEWLPAERGPDAALVQIVTRYLQAILQRLNQAPDKNKLAFLDLLGIQLIPAQAARAPIVFQLSNQAADVRIPAGTRIAAPPPPERTDQIVFETERSTGLAAARLKEVVSLWPGRDQYIDHSFTFLSGSPFQPFRKRELEYTPHIIYLAHDTLLALAGKSTVDVTVELTTTSSERLDIFWEYWDGKIWREFMNMRPACDEEARKLDSTDGLQRSGRFRLQTDCAETSKTPVNGIEAFWVRGRLTEPLPLDPKQILPQLESVRLSSVVERPLRDEKDAAGKPTGKKTGLLPDQAFTDQTRLDLTKPFFPYGPQPQPGNAFYFSNEEIFSKPGAKVEIVVVRAETPLDKISLPAVIRVTPDKTSILADNSTNSEITVDVRDIKNTPVTDGTVVKLSTTRGTFANNQNQITLVTAGGLAKTKIKSDQKGYATITAQCGLAQGIAFILFAEQESPGTGSRPRDMGTGESPARIKAEVSWEYWNGKKWTAIPGIDGPDLNTDKIIRFTVPLDMVRTKVNDKEGFWVRVRLINGGFGFIQPITWTDEGSKTPNHSAYIIVQPPSLSDFRLGYIWQYGPFPAEHVLAYNDFQYEDRTEEAKWPGQSFQPFKPVSDFTPALYLGFDKPLPVDRLGIYFDILEQRGETEGPALLWQYWDGISWQDLAVEDETRNFRLPGIVAFIGPNDSQPLARFGTPLNWLRARLKEDGPPGEPTINGIFPNAAWAIQHQTVLDEPIGISTGQPNQAFTFRQIPVLAGQHLEVRELAGPRANVEWHILAMELFNTNNRLIQEVEAMLASESIQTDIEKGDLRLKRDRNKRVTEVWVKWQERKHLFFSGPNDRHYLVERARGRLLFGDGERGKIPPLGAAILARQYRTGGGLVGNVGMRKITQLLAGVGAVEAVFNPRPAEGGADGETLENYSVRAPQTLCHRGRAIAPRDYETLAYEASPAVAVARAIPCRDADGHQMPGWVTVVIIPSSAEARPWPSFGLREQVRIFIEERATADLAAAHHTYVSGPTYQAVDVETTLTPVDPAEAGTVEALSRQALETFLHPLRGGTDGRGWEPGRDVFLSDIAAVLERVKGVDYVQELALLLNGALQGEQVKVAEDQVVVAGQIRIKVLKAEG